MPVYTHLVFSTSVPVPHHFVTSCSIVKSGGRGCNYHRVGRDPNPRRREADNRCIRNCRSVSCERKCSALENVEDVEYIADFLENMDVDFIADFLEDVAYGEDFEDSYDEDKSHYSQDFASS